MDALYNLVYGVMKHIDLASDKDRADLERADSLVDDGKKLRARVLNRLRQRARNLRLSNLQTGGLSNLEKDK